MRIEKCLNIDPAGLLKKKFNIFLGISIGNKYFTQSHIADYLLWAIENTKERVAVLIPDKIHAVNYEVRNGCSTDRATNLARKEGDKIEGIVRDILTEFDMPQRAVVDILRWEDIETKSYELIAEILRNEFTVNEHFKAAVIEVVKENVQSAALTDAEYEKLASYPLAELPMLIGGIEHRGVKYDLLPYPGVSKIDRLAVDLQEGRRFPEIAWKFEVETKLGLIEAYAD